jgi:hypothetical protein
MRYCPKCGKENNDDAEFCKHCGEKIAKVTYVKTRVSGWDAGRIIVTIIGVIMVFTAFGLIIGGASLRFIRGTIMDEQGFIVSSVEGISSSSYALVFQDIDVHMDYEASRVLRAIGGNIVFKMEVQGENPSQAVFIGVAMESDAASYLGEVEYDRLVSKSWGYDPLAHGFPDYTLSRHSGSAPSGPPTIHSFWVAHQTGTGNQALTWSPTTGKYWVVVMNQDASAEVNVDVKLGARVPLIESLGGILLTIGVLIGLVGGFIVYNAVIRR